MVCLLEVNKIIKTKCSHLTETSFLNDAHLMEKGSLKLEQSTLSSTEKYNGVICTKHKQFLKSNNTTKCSFVVLLQVNEISLTVNKLH